MTKRNSSRNGLRSSVSQIENGVLKAAAWAEAARLESVLAPLVEVLEGRQMMSSSWFVSPGGSDKNPGTLAQPFQTIQAAANVAQAGDHVEIEKGTYRETVVPAHSGTAANPIVYEAYEGQSVTISGADVITNWSNDTGNIYQASMSEDLGEGNNEVFVDGQALNEARSPNTSLDLSHPTMNTMDKVTLGTNSATIYDSALSQSANYWKGAIIHMTPGEQWEAQTGTVTSSSPGQITISYTPGNQYELPTAGSPYYLTGTFKALDTAGEWYRDPTSDQLMVWTPTGDSPANHTVEVKARENAFDLDNKAYITIKNVNIFAATIHTNINSSHTVLDGINAKYTSQFLQLVRGWTVPVNAGIMLEGPGSLLENSTVAFSPGDGVFMSGAGSRVTNTIIHDVDYDGGDAAGIRDYSAGSEIDHCTIYNTGRDGILHQASNVQILYNTIHDFGQQTTDSGAIYTVRSDGGGSVIAYNDIYSAHSGGYGETGLYLDNYSSNYVVHDNVTSDVDTAIKLNFTSENQNIYNNTLDATEYSVNGNFVGDWNGTTFTNNVMNKSASYGKGAVVKGSATAVASGKGAADFTSGATVKLPTGGTTTTTGSGNGSTTTGSTSGGSSSTTTGSGSSTTGGSTTTGSKSGGSSTTTATGGSGSSTTSGSTTTGSTSGSTSSGSAAGGTTSGSSSSGKTGSGTTTTTTGSGTSSAGSSGSTSTTTHTGSTGGSTTTGTTGTTGSTTGTGTTSAGSGTTSTGTGTTTTGSKSGTTTTGGQSGSGTTSTGGSSGTTSTGTSTGSTSSGAKGGTSTTTGTTSGTSSDTGSSSTTSAGSAGSSTTSQSGAGATDSGSGAATDPGSGDAGDSSNPLAPPVSPGKAPSVGASAASSAAKARAAELRAVVKADRAAVVLARQQRLATLKELIANRRADKAAFAAAKRKVASARQKANRVKELISSDKLVVQQLRQSIAADQKAIKAARHSDFTGVQADRLKLKADMNELKKSAA